MDSFVDEQISKSVFEVKEIKLKKIISTIAQIEILLNFYNDLGFDFDIKYLKTAPIPPPTNTTKAAIMFYEIKFLKIL